MYNALNLNEYGCVFPDDDGEVAAGDTLGVPSHPPSASRLSFADGA